MHLAQILKNIPVNISSNDNLVFSTMAKL